MHGSHDGAVGEIPVVMFYTYTNPYTAVQDHGCVHTPRKAAVVHTNVHIIVLKDYTHVEHTSHPQFGVHTLNIRAEILTCCRFHKGNVTEDFVQM